MWASTGAKNDKKPSFHKSNFSRFQFCIGAEAQEVERLTTKWNVGVWFRSICQCVPGKNTNLKLVPMAWPTMHDWMCLEGWVLNCVVAFRGAGKALHKNAVNDICFSHDIRKDPLKNPLRKQQQQQQQHQGVEKTLLSAFNKKKQ